MGLELIKNINSGIQALIAATANVTAMAGVPASAQTSSLQKKRELLERSIQLRVRNISRIEVQSSTSVAIFCQLGSQMVCREITGSPSRVKNLVEWAQQLNSEIRVRYV